MAQKKKAAAKKTSAKKSAPPKKKAVAKKNTAAKKPTKKKTAAKPKTTARKPKAKPKKKAVARKPKATPKKQTAASKPKAAPKKKAAASKPKAKPRKKATATPAPKATAKKKSTTSKPKARTAKARPSATAAPARRQSAPPVKPKKEVKESAPAKRKRTVKAETAPVSVERQATGKRRSGGVNLKFLVSVAQAIKDAVAPLAQAIKGREVVDEAPSGDVTFLLDRVAEKALLTHLSAAGLPIAYYSEHEGYSTFSSKAPKSLLLVDPIDGTRAAKSGFEGCVVAVASTRVIERPTIADIECACVMDLLGGRIFLAERGKGARVYMDNRLKRPKLSTNTDLEALTWAMTIPARPAELIFPTAARIIDLSSLKGGFFACNSTSFSLTRLVTNQLDACVDVANRYYRDIPDRVEDYFINAGRGKVIGVTPYDFAAALLIAEEAGCVVTDAYGNRFDDLLLLDSSKSNHHSIIAAANAQLHEKLLGFFDTRIKQYELLLTRHGNK